MNQLKTFQFKEGTVIASVSEEVEFDMKAKTITQTGRFYASLIGGTVPNIKPTKVMDRLGKSPRIFCSAEEAFKAAHKVAVELGYHPVPTARRRSR